MPPEPIIVTTLRSSAPPEPPPIPDGYARTALNLTSVCGRDGVCAIYVLSVRDELQVGGATGATR